MLRPILDVAGDLGLGDHAFAHGPHRAKVSLDALADAPPGRGRYVLVTAVTPTGAGEGKTVTSLSLAMGLARRGRRAVAALRQSSLGPTLGMKGGGAGGGRARIEPLEECLLGLGHDLFAVESATNLLAAAVDDALTRDATRFEPSTVWWRRVIDMDDRGLRHVVTGLGGKANGVVRESGFDITAASEVMAVLALSRDWADLRARLGRIVPGFAPDGSPVTANDLHVAGAMAALLRDALHPNLLQTTEGTPVLVHAGPFANIAFGNSSVVADLVALPRADYVVTEAGFGADLGAEKFVHLKCLASGLSPDAVVLVATVRAVRHHDPAKGTGPAAVAAGAVNLRRHVATLRSYGVPVVVAINRFPDDTPEELAVLHEQAGAAGAVAVADHTGFADGGAGSEALAEAVEAACAGPVALRRAYAADATIPDKLDALARQVYGAGSVRWEPTALRSLERITKAGHGALPVCVAKTNLSLSHDPTLLGAPEGFVFPVRDVRLYAGAGYVTVLAGEIMTMPGLPSKPKYADIDLLPDGTVVGLV